LSLKSAKHEIANVISSQPIQFSYLFYNNKPRLGGGLA